MEDDTERLFYLALGPMAAILLGAALVPLRGYTTASNFAFVFVALTIVVAELGGRRAAAATALVSALSLDFFLTQPYLRLAMEDKHDVIAFVGLAVCGLLAAALGSARRERIAALTTARKHRDVLRTVLREWDATAPVGPQLAKALRASREVFPVTAAVVRNERGSLVASSNPADGLRTVPEEVLQPDLLLRSEGSGSGRPRRSVALPEKGGRIALLAGARPLGWLDVWGNGVAASAETRRGLCDLARLIAVLLAGAGSGVISRD